MKLKQLTLFLLGLVLTGCSSASVIVTMEDEDMNGKADKITTEAVTFSEGVSRYTIIINEYDENGMLIRKTGKQAITIWIPGLAQEISVPAGTERLIPLDKPVPDMELKLVPPPANST